MAKRVDMAGKSYGCITALKPTGKAASRDTKWLFHCSCGNDFECNGYYVRTGKVTSCQACAAERRRQANLTHGLSNSAEFAIWTDMHTRCYNPNATSYPNYGGRGISICERWRVSFLAFLGDMGQRPGKEFSIERIDVNGNYAPENCKWATDAEQALNKRNNVRIEIDGQVKTLSEWCRDFGVFPATASLRYRKGHRGRALFQTTVQRISFNGITDTVAGWSARTGIKKSTISMRINTYKWPAQRALTEGALL